MSKLKGPLDANCPILSKGKLNSREVKGAPQVRVLGRLAVFTALPYTMPAGLLLRRYSDIHCGSLGRFPCLVALTSLPLQVSDRFFPYSAINTDAILSLDAHSSLSTSEVRTGPKRSPEWVGTEPEGPGSPSDSLSWEGQMSRGPVFCL